MLQAAKYRVVTNLPLENVVLYCSLSGCPKCKQFDKRSYHETHFPKYKSVTWNCDDEESSAFAQRHGVNNLPAALVFNERGECHHIYPLV